MQSAESSGFAIAIDGSSDERRYCYAGSTRTPDVRLVMHEPGAPFPTYEGAEAAREVLGEGEVLPFVAVRLAHLLAQALS